MITLLAVAITGLLIAGWVTRSRNARESRQALEQVRMKGADRRIPILMPVCGRPHYLRQVLGALAHVQDIDRAVLVVSQDGRNPEVSALISSIGFTEAVVIRHTCPFLGIFTYLWDGLHAASVNIRFLLDFAFAKLGAPYAIVLEDDLIVSPDFLRYFSWASRHILSDERVLSVAGFNLHSRISPAENYDPRESPYVMVENREEGRLKFTGWGWAITGTMWRRIRKAWSCLSWDTGLDETQRKLGLLSYKPALGRVRNIGMQGGINFTEAEGNPKWTELTVSERVYPYDQVPVLLAADPVLPPFRDRPPDRPVRNERQRTRARRLWFLALAAAVAAVEYILLERS